MEKINRRLVMAVLGVFADAKRFGDDCKLERWATRWALKHRRMQVRW